LGRNLTRGRRSVLVRMTEDGRKLETARTGNSPAALRTVMARAGNCPRVVVEATYGWYWAAATSPSRARRSCGGRMVEAVQHQPAGSPPRDLKDAIIARRGKEARNIAKAAAARKLLTCVYLRDARRGGQVPGRPQEHSRDRVSRPGRGTPHAPAAASRGNPEGMTAARRLPTERLHRGAGPQPHTRLFPPPHYPIAGNRLKDASRRRWRGRAPPGP
jgi:hypothetical protein